MELGRQVLHGLLEGADALPGNQERQIDHVIEVVHGAGIAKKLARLRPLAVIKG